MFPLLVSIVNLILTGALFYAFRLMSPKIISRRYHLHVEEFLTTMEFCCGCCELAFICDNYGAIIFGICLFWMCLWWCHSFGDASANPNKYIEDVIRGHMRINQAAQIIFVELVAGSLVFVYMRSLWGFGWSSAHQHRSLETTCDADLQVTVKNGAIIEGVITFIDRLNALTLEDLDWPHSTLISAMLSTFLVISALHSSGGYFNPVLASSLKLGCKGHSFGEFVMVYWIGSIIGSIIALTFHRAIGVRKIIEITNLKHQLQINNKKHL